MKVPSKQAKDNTHGLHQNSAKHNSKEKLREGIFPRNCMIHPVYTKLFIPKKQLRVSIGESAGSLVAESAPSQGVTTT